MNYNVFGNKGYFAMRDGFKVAVVSNRAPDDADNTDIEQNVDVSKFTFIKIE